MAHHESDREDLMREATALRHRIEFELPGEDEPIVAGFRDNCAFSIYFGSDPMFQFDAEGRLRRAFFDGVLYRTHEETLARLIRRRSKVKTELIRHDLSPDELQSFHDMLQKWLQKLATQLVEQNINILRQVPVDDDMCKRMQSAIDRCLQADPWLAQSINRMR